MEDGGMTNQSESAMAISVSVVYFYITSVHPRGNLTSREWSVSPLTKRLRLYQWGHDEFSADTHSVWALSEHAFKWTLSSSASYYTRISKLYLVKHYIKHNNNNRPSPPSSPPLHFLLPSLSHFLLWHFSFLVHITKDSFHLLFMMDSFTFF